MQCVSLWTPPALQGLHDQKAGWGREHRNGFLPGAFLWVPERCGSVHSQTRGQQKHLENLMDAVGEERPLLTLISNGEAGQQGCRGRYHFFREGDSTDPLLSGHTSGVWKPHLAPSLLMQLSICILGQITFRNRLLDLIPATSLDSLCLPPQSVSATL